MDTKFALYLFSRDDRSPIAPWCKYEPATDSAAVLVYWGAGAGRAAEVLIDDHEMLIAKLTFDAEKEELARKDLENLCRARALSVVTVDQLQVDKLLSE